MMEKQIFNQQIRFISTPIASYELIFPHEFLQSDVNRITRANAAVPDLIEALKSTRLMLYAWREVQEKNKWGTHPELERSIKQVEDALTLAGVTR